MNSKVYVVTGATSGIGKLLVEKLVCNVAFSMVLLRGPPAMAAGFHRASDIRGKSVHCNVHYNLALEIAHCYFLNILAVS